MSEELNPYESPKAPSETPKKMTSSGLPTNYVMVNTKLNGVLSRIGLAIVFFTGLGLAIWYLKLAQEFKATGEFQRVEGGFYDMMLEVEEIYEIAFWASVLLVAFWKFRTMKNAWAIMRTGVQPTVSPGWAVAWYIIPVANLWKPHTTMSEIVQNTFDSTNKYKIILRLWWVFWLLGTIVARVFRDSDAPENMVTYLNTHAFAISAIALAAGCLERIIARITAKQMEEFDKSIRI